MVKLLKPLILSLFLIVPWWWADASATVYSDTTIALRAAGIEYGGIGVEQPFSTLPSGFIRQEDIVGAPGLRIPHYAKSYGDNEYDYAFVSVGIFNGKIAFKLFQIVQNDKTHCMNTTVKTVEYLKGLGVTGWQKHWRQDYQVAQWKAYTGKYKFSVTCRMNEGVWLLEETRGLASVK